MPRGLRGIGLLVKRIDYPWETNMRTRSMTIVAMSVMSSSVAFAQTPVIYPAKNQTAEQQQKDVAECVAWSKQTTGIDPAVLAATPVPAAAPAAAPAPPPQTGPQGARVRGAARGAAAGAVVGEIANDDASEGAAIGAAAGAVAAGSRSRRERRHAEQQQEAQQQQQSAANQQAAQEAEAKRQEQLATYNRANTACLEGRGYVVK